MSPRKVRLVVDLIRGKAVPAAVTQLEFLPKSAAEPVLKLLKSAMANAEHNFKLDASTLRVKAIAANAGATLKRMRPRAHGAAAPIRKRTSHITITLTDEPAPAKKAKAKPAKKVRAKKPAKPAAPKVESAPAAEATPSTN
jgi:large subunit ribosomal protein L22